MLSVEKTTEGNVQGFTAYDSVESASQITGVLRSEIRQQSGIDNGATLKLIAEEDGKVKIYGRAVNDAQGKPRMHPTLKKPLQQFMVRAMVMEGTKETGKEVLIPLNFLERIATRWEEDGDSIVRKEVVRGVGALNQLWESRGNKDAALADLIKQQETHTKGFVVEAVPVQTAPFIEDPVVRAKVRLPKDTYQLQTSYVYNVNWCL